MDARHPFLNGLRGFDISCAGEDVTAAAALCDSLKSALEERLGKTVEIQPYGTLPPANTGLPLANRVWIAVTVAVDGDRTQIGARYGSTMRMTGVPAEVEAGPVDLNTGATPASQAEAILAVTPFRVP